MKGFLGPHIGRFLRRLPLPRIAFDDCDGTERLSTISQIGAYDSHRLQELVPVIRSNEERIRITALCRDADVLPRVVNAGCTVQQEDGTFVQIMHNGIRVLAGGYYGDWMQNLIARCKGAHEPQEEVAFAEVMRHLPDDATMIELGAYWSYYSIWFLTRGRGRRAIVVEPDPAHLEVGRTNARLNACEPQFVQAFVGRRAAPPSKFKTEESGEVELPCTSLPDLVESNAIKHVDLLHCDAQGAEIDILEGCQELAAAGRLGWVVVSTHSHHITGDPLTHQRCLALLARAGATILAEHDVQESFSGDGLIVAKFGSVPKSWQTPKLSYNRYSESLFRNPLYDLASAGHKAQASPADLVTLR
jgi:FkbM family methyltransferase